MISLLLVPSEDVLHIITEFVFKKDNTAVATSLLAVAGSLNQVVPNSSVPSSRAS